MDFDIDLLARQTTRLGFAGDTINRLFVASAAENLPDDPEDGPVVEIPKTRLRGYTGLEPMKFKG
jgi:hypothetical protein